MTAYVRLIDAAVNDLVELNKSNHRAVDWSLKKMLLLQENPLAGEPLLGELIRWRKLTVSDRHWRIVWRVLEGPDGTTDVEVAEVWAVGARRDSDVYAEMKSRLESLPDTPATATLADVVQQLAKDILGVATEPPARELIPDWLRRRLVHTAGYDAVTVEQMTLEQAVDAWTAWTTAPR